MFYYRYDGQLAARSAAPESHFYGTSAVDNFAGTGLAESFWGGDGDLMAGGAGDDTYYLKSAADRIVELPGAGVDTIVSWTNVYLAAHANLENVEVRGDKTYGAGNASNNVIEGGDGTQQLYGGQGLDVLVGGAGADTFIIVKGEGNDVIQDFVAGLDVVRLSAGFTAFTQVRANLSQVGADVRLDLGGGDGLLFRNLQVDQLSARDFALQLDTNELGVRTFSDEFNALSLWDAQANPGGTWRTDFGYQGENGVGSYSLVNNDEKQIYTSPYFRDHAGDFAETPFVANGDGTVSIWAKPSTNPEIFGYGYTSGLLTTQPTFSQTYGYFEMRADLPDAAGAWPAFWLIPADGSWPPELDVMETLTSDPRASWATSHSSLGGHTANGQFAFVTDTADGFHTYGALWTPLDITWYVDGVEVFRAATPADMNKPMFMIANLALGGWGGAIDAAALPAQMKIDYIRAFALKDAVPASTGQPAPPASPPTPPPTSGSSAGQVLTSTGYADTLTGGAFGDTINAGQGPDRLTGGAGADSFVFRNMPWNAGHITDFELGVDRLDVSALLPGNASAAELVAGGYLSYVSTGDGVRVLIDTDGAGGPNTLQFQVATLDGVSATGLSTAEFFSALVRSRVGLRMEGSASDGPLMGTDGNDTIVGADRVNFLRGADGDDVIFGGSTFDDMHGNKGNDTLQGGLGSDWVVGGQGDDRLFGDSGDDIVLGNLGFDTLDGGDGADVVRGGQADDFVFGGAGDDWLSGDRGSDTITGGAGADLFHSFSGAGIDVVTDFNAAEGDRVRLEPGTSYTLRQVGADTVIDMGSGDLLTLQNVTYASLSWGWIG